MLHFERAGIYIRAVTKFLLVLHLDEQCLKDQFRLQIPCQELPLQCVQRLLPSGHLLTSRTALSVVVTEVCITMM